MKIVNSYAEYKNEIIALFTLGMLYHKVNTIKGVKIEKITHYRFNEYGVLETILNFSDYYTVINPCDKYGNPLFDQSRSNIYFNKPCNKKTPFIQIGKKYTLKINASFLGRTLKKESLVEFLGYDNQPCLFNLDLAFRCSDGMIAFFDLNDLQPV